MSTSRRRIVQIGFLVHDVKKSAEEFERWLGIHPNEMKCIGDDPNQGGTTARYLGNPCFGKNNQIVFDLDNIQIELIEPAGEEPSIWKDCLKQQGEGIHHIAFVTDNLNTSSREMEESGMACLQSGSWKDGDQFGYYAYFDGKEKLKTIIEFLQIPSAADHEL